MFEEYSGEKLEENFNLHIDDSSLVVTVGNIIPKAYIWIMDGTNYAIYMLDAIASGFYNSTEIENKLYYLRWSKEALEELAGK